ncbi:ATP-binding protein [Caminibacter mediatlanticus]|uniref:Sensory/regulatory protein RpfC n=1 Tax=Caminibacter mediatlanticus TB-2 TaxID=391592 RepID=A0AAI9AI29_9BACT|nr:ATP-binding protein [Caminibacter mediatlanticus]EDM23902.1 histidine kinase [Caminibacter mediatlanticus TB-2]
MRGSLVKLISIVVFVPTLILLSISGFFLYKNFVQYQKVQESKKYLELTKKLENMLIYLGQERGVSSIYSVSKGKYPNIKKLITQKRILFSNSINDLKQFINKNPEFYKNVNNIISLANNLPVIRKKIDTFKDNYIKTYFFTYYNKLEQEILKSLTQIQAYYPDKIKSIYAIKLPIEKIIAYSGIIRGFGSYYITADTPMSEKEYKNILLKYYHDSNLLLKSPNIEKFFNNSEFKKIEKDIKTVIFYLQQANMQYYINNTFDGYAIDAYDYFNLFTKRINFFNNSVNKLNNEVNTNLNLIVKNATNNLIINSIIFLLSILILILGMYIVKLIKSHINELSNLLTTLAPITGKNIQIDISSTKGINEAIKVVNDSIKIIQESIKKSEEATKAKSLFLANMSHEIRTPLNGILGFLEILKTTDLTPEQEEYVDTISQSAKNLLQIVNNILDISKIESNKVTIEEIEFKALDEFESTLEIFATPASHKHIQYVTEISPNMPSILKGDILKIKEIITNLINNAIKFTPENGIISVKILLQEIINNKAKIYFEVRDTGIGMSEAQKAKIFEAFTQADASVTRKYGGTGLGLTIVKSYLEMMGSHINVESEINKGSRFYFTINLEVIDSKPRYKQNSFNNTTLAILNTSKETLRKEYAIEYLNYFGVSRIGFNNKNELIELKNSEKIDAIVVFFEESNKEDIFELTDLNIPIITITSFVYKENIDKLNPEASIFDPNYPSKTYQALSTIKNKAPIIQKRKTTIQEKPIYQIKALIAEDNPINRKLLQTKLKSMGIESDIATNGLDAFNKYTMYPEKYDVIFMDIQMPTMDGIEATQEIIEFEKEEGIPHTPIIAVTANVLKGDKERFLGTGMDDYISKPIETNELERVIKNIAKHKYTPNEEIEEQNSIQESKEPIKAINVESNKENKIIVATESSFLTKYLKSILEEDFDIASNLNELNKKIDNNTILIIEENFNEADMNILINTIKEDYPNIKILVIGDTNYENINGIIQDLNPETLNNAIKKIKGNQ